RYHAGAWERENLVDALRLCHPTGGTDQNNLELNVGWHKRSAPSKCANLSPNTVIIHISFPRSRVVMHTKANPCAKAVKSSNLNNLISLLNGITKPLCMLRINAMHSHAGAWERENLVKAHPYSPYGGQ